MKSKLSSNFKLTTSFRLLSKFIREQDCFRLPRRPNRKVWLGLLIGIGVYIGSTASGQAFDWPTMRGNPEGTGFSSEQLPAEPVVLWEFKTGRSEAGFEATPVIYKGRVFIGDFEGNVYAIDLQTGKEVWRKKAEDGIVTSGACAEGKLVVGDFNSKVYCYQVSDGELLWSKELEQPVISGGNFFGSNVLLSSDSGCLHSLKLADGEEAWMFETGDQLRSTASLWKETALLGGCDSRLHRIQVATGSAVGEGTSLMAPTMSTPNVIGDIVIIPTQPGNVLAVRAETGEVVWNYQPPSGSNADIRGSAASKADWNEGKLEGIIVVPSRNRRLLGLNAADGSLKWEAVLKKRADGSPVICDGRAWIGASDGMVYAIGTEDGKQTWSYQLAGQILGSPAISDGRLLIATEKGSLVCFGENATSSQADGN